MESVEPPANDQPPTSDQPPDAPAQQKKKRKRSGKRLSKAERLAKRAALDSSAPPAEAPSAATLAQIAEFAKDPQRWDDAERVAADADAADVAHTLAFLGALCRRPELRCRALAHYGARVRPGARRAAIAASLTPALVAEGRYEAAAAVARALGDVAAAKAAAEAAVAAAADAGARRAREGAAKVADATAAHWGLGGAAALANAPGDASVDGDPEEDDDGSDDGDDDDAGPAALSQFARIVARDPGLCGAVVADDRAWNFVSRERRRALRICARALRAARDRGGGGADDAAALGAALRAAAAAPADRAARDAAAADVAALVEARARAVDGGAVAAAFGSLATRLDDAAASPDCDVVVFLPGAPAAATATAEATLGALAAALRADGCAVAAVARARVPLLKCVFADRRADVVVNNVAAAANTELLRRLGDALPALAPLVRAARVFARSRGVLGAHRRALSSYAWTLLCVVVLQRRGEAPALGLGAAAALLSDAATNPADARARVAGAVAADVAAAFAGFAAPRDDDAGLGARFVDLLAVLAFRRDDVLSLRGPEATRAGWRAPPGKHMDRLRLEDPLETRRDLGRALTRRTNSQLRRAALAALVNHLPAGAGRPDAPVPAWPFAA
jgi:hypothetical protein